MSLQRRTNRAETSSDYFIFGEFYDPRNSKCKDNCFGSLLRLNISCQKDSLMSHIMTGIFRTSVSGTVINIMRYST